jgi:phospholipid/cholesterol/gamma-HCH transport system substrate-binding protein
MSAPATAPAAPRAPAPGTARPSRAAFKARRRLSGVAFLAVLALLAWLAVALYNHQFTPVTLVTLYTDSVGNEMHQGAMVMVRGVQVGSVREISADGSGARLELALQPGIASRLPANVTAEMLPTTLFGERYVDLILPARRSAQTLAVTRVIRQDRSADAIELEKVLDNLLPTLQAVEPDKLSVTLSAIAQGLQGRGAELGKTLVALNSYLGAFNPHLAQMDHDIRQLAALTRVYRQAAPSILQALDDFTVPSQTLASLRAQFAAALATMTTATADLRAFLDANSANLIKLGADSVTTLRILARYAPEFPCVLKDLVKFEPNMNKVLGQGTSQPGLHAQAVVVPVYASDRYLPNKDTPVYGDNLGPHCYGVPFPGITLNDGTTGTSGPGQGPLAAGAGAGGVAPARPGAGAAAAASSAGTAAASRAPGWPGAYGSLAGSPGEAELVRELAALSLRTPPARLPGWSSLLLAPLYRGAMVQLEASRT